MEKNSDKMIDLIKKIISKLNNEKVPYVILRNYEGLPEYVGNDIDLLVSEEYMDQFSDLIYEIGLNEGWYLKSKQKRYAFRSLILFHGENINDTLKIDVWAPITWKGLTWIDSDFIFKNRILYSKGFYVLPNGSEAAVLVLKEILQSGTFREKYFDRIKQFSIEDSENFIAVLKKYFDEDLINDLLSDCNNGNWDEIKKKTGKYRNNLILKSIKREHLKVFFKLIKFATGHLKEKSWSKEYLFVSLIGPDGSGKTTSSRNLKSSLNELFVKNYYFHGHYGFFPELKNLVPGKKYKKIGKNYEKNLNSNSPKTPLAVILVLYYSLEYLLGYHYLKIKNRNKRTLMLFDRYFYDYLIQPGPFQMDNSLIRILFKIVPSPDIVIFLKSPADLVYKRKPELEVSEIQRQLDICQEIIDLMHFSYKVDNSKPLDEVMQEIRKEIYIKLGQKVYNQ